MKIVVIQKEILVDDDRCDSLECVIDYLNSNSDLFNNLSVEDIVSVDDLN